MGSSEHLQLKLDAIATRYYQIMQTFGKIDPLSESLLI